MKTLFVFILVLPLASCGGGGGNGDAELDAPQLGAADPNTAGVEAGDDEINTSLSDLAEPATPDSFL